MGVDIVWLQTQFPDLSKMKLVGSGGQKEVFSAVHKTNGDVVLKIFHPQASPDRAKREVEAELKINCLRIPPIYERGDLSCSTGQMMWVREKFVKGEDLRDKLKKFGVLNEKQVLGIALHMLEALTAAEAVRIVHRDIKPANILCGDDGNNWLLDFGFSRHLDLVSLTATGGFGMGTVGYCPVEQFRNFKNDIDSRTDLFGLGITLFECVEGYNPFWKGARDNPDVLNRTEHVPVAAITRPIDAAGQFKDLVMAMTRTRRDQRIGKASEAYEWIKEICGKEGVA